MRQELIEGRFGELVSIRCYGNFNRSAYAVIADRVHRVFRTLIHDIDAVEALRLAEAIMEAARSGTSIELGGSDLDGSVAD
jgi:hypothetical protein